MFTGIVTDVGEVLAVTPLEAGVRLRIATSYRPEDIAIGASIACSGPCLTVVDLGMAGNRGFFDVEASSETLERTNMRAWSPGRRINLERALKLGDELGGHMVTGHIDGVAMIAERRDEGAMARFTFAAPEALARYIAEKGSVSLDGTSLTVNGVRRQPLRRDDHPAYAHCHDLGRAAARATSSTWKSTSSPAIWSACAAPLERAGHARPAGPCSARFSHRPLDNHEPALPHHRSALLHRPRRRAGRGAPRPSWSVAAPPTSGCRVPGVLEIPAALAMALKAKDKEPRYAGYVLLGCVIRGETTHYDIVANESARAVMTIATENTLAVGNGILTVENGAQAWARARVSEKNKGAGAAAAAFEMAALREKLGLSHG